MLGAGRLRTFGKVTLPLLLPAIASSALLAFAFSFTSFGVVLILGGAQFATLEVTIYELTAKLFRLPLAGALSVVQIVFTYLFLLLYVRPPGAECGATRSEAPIGHRSPKESHG